MSFGGCLLRLIVLIVIIMIAWPILTSSSKFVRDEVSKIKKGSESITRTVKQTIQDL